MRGTDSICWHLIDPDGAQSRLSDLRKIAEEPFLKLTRSDKASAPVVAIAAQSRARWGEAEGSELTIHTGARESRQIGGLPGEFLSCAGNAESGKGK